eukprot:1881406-Amphidinium_carterae.3
MDTHEEESDQQHADDVTRSFNIFHPENQPEHAAHGTHPSTSEAAPPINVAPPPPPPPPQRTSQSHLTHLPFTSWCEICARAKARGTYHEVKLKSKSIIQMDCTFLKHQGEPSQRTKLVTILTMVETITGMSNAVIVENKGVTQYALGEVKKFILENGFINSVIQVEGEPTMKRFAETLTTSLTGEVKSKLSHAYSHQSLGVHTQLFNHLRLLKLQMSEQFGIPSSQDGQTPYLRTWGQKYKSAIIAFGETVLCQRSLHDNQKIPIRLEPQVVIWNLDHLTLTSEGLIKSRSVRRLTLPNRINVAILRSAIGTPSDPSGRLQEKQDDFNYSLGCHNS